MKKKNKDVKSSATYDALPWSVKFYVKNQGSTYRSCTQSLACALPLEPCQVFTAKHLPAPFVQYKCTAAQELVRRLAKKTKQLSVPFELPCCEDLILLYGWMKDLKFQTFHIRRKVEKSQASDDLAAPRANKKATGHLSQDHR